MARYVWLWLVLLFVITGCSGPSTTSDERVEKTAARARLTVIGAPNASGVVDPFGRPDMVTFGQTITAPAAPDTTLASFSFVMSVPSSVVFRGHVYAWYATKAIGPSLWDGPPQSTSGTANETVVFSPNVVLSPGKQYVLFASCVEDSFPSASGAWSIDTSRPYTGGYMVYLGHTTVGEWTTINWGALATDLTFSAVFGQPTPTTTTVASSVNPSLFGQSITLTATVTSGEGTPTGSVEFFDGVTSLGTRTLNGAGQASLSTAALGAGSHSITAKYAGAGLFIASGSNPLNQIVGKADTATALVSATNPAIVNQVVSFTATVSAVAPGAGTPTGSVELRRAGSVISTASVNASGVATFALANPVGTNSLVATYVGDGNFKSTASPALSQVVNQDGASVVLGSSPNPSTYSANATFTATVTSAGPGGMPTGDVTFREGLTVLGTGTLNGSGVATFSIASLLGGSHTITAAYGGDANHTAASGTVTHVVNVGASTTTTASLTNPSVFGQSVTLTATVTGGGVTPGGTVTFREGTTVLASSTLSGSGVATLQAASLSVGAHSIVATYNGNSNYASSVAAAISQKVDKASTTTNISSSSNPSIAGGNVTFTATVTAVLPGAGTAAGIVEFFDGATSIGSANLNGSGVATVSSSALVAGTHAVRAVYAGNASFTSSTSANVSQVVNKDGTAVAVTRTPSPSTFGGNVTFTATVTSSGSGGLPTGTVIFSDGATNLGTGTLNGSGVATFTTASLAAGAHTINAAYGGDGDHNAASGSVSHVVNPAASTTILASSKNPAAFGQNVTFTAKVASTAPGTPSGTVTFMNGSTTLGTGVLDGSGIATFSTNTLTVATHPISAVYAGAGNYAGSTSTALSQVVDKAATATAIASSSNPSLIGTSVTFTATVTRAAPGAGIPSGTVTFKNGAAMLGTGTLDGSGIATFATSALATGDHDLTVEYGGDGSFLTSTSAELTQNVNSAAATIAVTTTPTPSTFGQEVTLTATLTGDKGVPTGNVSFKNGVTSIGTAALDANGVVTVKTASLLVGTHTLTAEYSGDATYATGSGSVAHTVNKATTTTTVASSATPSTLGSSVLFTATVTASVTGFTGSVEFFDGATSLGTSALTTGTATFTTATLTAGGHAITAKYLADTTFAESTSTALTQTVNAAPHPSAPDAGADHGDDEVAAAAADTGCGCRESPTPAGGTGLAVLAGILALAVRRRRERRLSPGPCEGRRRA
jgi:MYXO-CTERM domain-containing protein